MIAVANIPASIVASELSHGNGISHLFISLMTNKSSVKSMEIKC
jgi:hypothetical protein